jgi:hypothetical protein
MSASAGAVFDAILNAHADCASAELERPLCSAVRSSANAAVTHLHTLTRALQERVEWEYNLDLVTTAPTVVYKTLTTDGEEVIFTSFLNLLTALTLLACRSGQSARTI